MLMFALLGLKLKDAEGPGGERESETATPTALS